MDGILSFIFTGNGPAICADDRFGGRKADAISRRTAVAGRIGTVETLKEALGFTFRQLLTAIDRLEDGIAVPCIDMDFDRRSIHGVLDGVVQ